MAASLRLIRSQLGDTLSYFLAVATPPEDERAEEASTVSNSLFVTAHDVAADASAAEYEMHTDALESVALTAQTLFQTKAVHNLYDH